MSAPASGDATDYALQLAHAARTVLAEHGHFTCSMLPDARYEPESGAVVCGCGVFEDWAPESPPWAQGERSDAQEMVEQLAQHGGGDPYEGPPESAPPARGGHLPYQAADPISSMLALIDPTELYTPAEVEQHILDVLYRLETGALFERETVIRAGQTKQAFTMAYEKAIHLSEQSGADRRKAEAMVRCEAEFNAMNEAAMLKEAAKATMHNLRAVLSGYQSTARSVGATYQAGGSQGGVPNQQPGRHF